MPSQSGEDRPGRSHLWRALPAVSLAIAVYSALIAMGVWWADLHLVRGAYHPSDALVLIAMLVGLPIQAIGGVTALVLGSVGIARVTSADTSSVKRTEHLISLVTSVLLALATIVALMLRLWPG